MTVVECWVWPELTGCKPSAPGGSQEVGNHVGMSLRNREGPRGLPNEPLNGLSTWLYIV